jgi:ribosomal protein L39E
MTRHKRPSLKVRLAKAAKQTKWAPYWIVPKINAKGKVVHPGRYTHVKRSWRRGKIES